MRPILDGGADARHFVYFHRLRFSFCYLRENCEKINFLWEFRIGLSMLPSVVRLFSRFPSGAILVGVTCLNLFIWITSLSRRANALSQTSHMYLQAVGTMNEIWNIFFLSASTYGFSPVWIRMWIVNLSLRANPLPHTVHSNALLAAENKFLFNLNFGKSLPKLALLLDGACFRELCEACWTCCSAFNRLAGCIEPPSTYGSMNGIRFGRGTFAGTSGVQLPRLWSTRTPLSYPMPPSSGTVNVFSPEEDVICGTCTWMIMNMSSTNKYSSEMCGSTNLDCVGNGIRIDWTLMWATNMMMMWLMLIHMIVRLRWWMIVHLFVQLMRYLLHVRLHLHVCFKIRTLLFCRHFLNVYCAVLPNKNSTLVFFLSRPSATIFNKNLPTTYLEVYRCCYSSHWIGVST